MPNGAITTFAGFGDFDPVLIAPDQTNRVTACLRALAGHPQAAQIFDAAGMLAAHDDYWPQEGSWQSQLKPYIVKQGVLQIPVKGVLLHNFPFQVGSYATGYYYIQKALERGLADPEVKGIALVCDSPGGHVAGCFEMVDRIYDARKYKPIAAFAHEHAYSAAYAIASAAKKITMSRTGGVGSIGVVTMHVDVSKMLDQEGIKVTFIFAGKHKVDGNAYEPLSEGAKERIQARIDETYGVFTSSVARNRNIEESAVKKTEALTFGATEAMDRSLADAVGPLDEAMAEFCTGLLGPEGDENMAMTPEEKAAHEAAIAAAATEGQTAGAGAERKRIAGIKALDEAKARPQAAESVCMNTDMSVEAAKAFLATLPEEKPAKEKATNSGDEGFKKQMQRESAAAAGAGDPDEEDEEELSDDAKADATAVRLLDAKFGRGSTAKVRTGLKH